MKREEITRANVGSYLLNAKIELSKAINMIDQLEEEGKAEPGEFGKLYNIKNELRDYIEKYRKITKEKESD